MLKVLSALAIFAGLICIVDFETSRPPFCIGNYPHQSYTDQQNENCAPLSRTVIAHGREGSVVLGHFVHDFKDEIIASFTVILAIATIYLWAATRDLVRGSEKVAQTQLRAFVFAKGFEQFYNVFTDRPQPYIREYVFSSKIENVGLTPATDVKLWIHHQILPISENKEPRFEWRDIGTSGVLGPRGTGQTSYHPIPVEAMISLWERNIEIYLATRIEYRDIFNPSIVHHHEQCAILDLLRPPADVEGSPEDRKNIPRVTLRLYGPQNTVA